MAGELAALVSRLETAVERLEKAGVGDKGGQGSAAAGAEGKAGGGDTSLFLSVCFFLFLSASVYLSLAFFLFFSFTSVF